jgi:hypothetical protein
MAQGMVTFANFHIEYPRYSADEDRLADCIGGSEVALGVCLDFHNIWKGLKLLKGEKDHLMMRIKVGLDHVGFEDSMGQVGAVGM